MGLSTAEIQALYAKRRVKGLYDDCLAELLTKSDEAGVNVVDAWPTFFTGKNSTTLAQGFTSAAKKAEVTDKVDIINTDGVVYIMVKDRLELDDEATDEEAAELLELASNAV